MQRVWRGEIVVDGLAADRSGAGAGGRAAAAHRVDGPEVAGPQRGLGRRASPASISGPDPAGVDATFRRAEEAWAAAGRAEPPWLSTSSWFALGDDAADRLAEYAYNYLSNFGDRAARAMAALCRLSDAGAMRETLAALSETGCHEVVLVPTTTDIAELDRLLDVVA